MHTHCHTHTHSRERQGQDRPLPGHLQTPGACAASRSAAHGPSASGVSQVAAHAEQALRTAGTTGCLFPTPDPEEGAPGRVLPGAKCGARRDPPGPERQAATHPRLWTLGRGELPRAKWGEAKEAKDPGGLMPSSAHRSPGPWTEAGRPGPSPSRPWETASQALAGTRDADAALSLSERLLPAPPPCPSPGRDRRCPHPVGYPTPGRHSPGHTYQPVDQRLSDP